MKLHLYAVPIRTITYPVANSYNEDILHITEAADALDKQTPIFRHNHRCLFSYAMQHKSIFPVMFMYTHKCNSRVAQHTPILHFRFGLQAL